MQKKNLTFDEQRALMEIDAGLYQYIENPEKEITSLALRKNIKNLLHVKDYQPSYNEIYKFAQKFPKEVRHLPMHYLTEDVLTRLNTSYCDREIFKEIPLPKSLQISLASYISLDQLDTNDADIMESFLKVQPKYIKDFPRWNTKEMQEKVIQYNPNSLRYIENPSEEIILFAAKQEENISETIFHSLDHDIQMKLLAIKGSYLYYYEEKNRTEERTRQAMKSQSKKIIYLKYMPNATKEERLTAIQLEPKNILYIDQPSVEEEICALDGNVNIIKEWDDCHVKTVEHLLKLRRINQLNGIVIPKKIQTKIIQKKPNAIKYLSTYDVDMVLIAIKKDPSLFYVLKEEDKIKQIRNQEEVLLYVAKNHQEYAKTAIIHLYRAIKGEQPYEEYLDYFLKKYLQKEKEQHFWIQAKQHMFETVLEGVLLMKDKKNQRKYLASLEESMSKLPKEKQKFYQDALEFHR